MSSRKDLRSYLKPLFGTAVAATLAVFVCLVPVADAGSPTMSTGPGSSGVCLGPEDICIPPVDIFTNFPGPALPLTFGGFLGLGPGDVVTGLSYGVDSFVGGETICGSVAAGVTGAAPDIVAEAAGVDEVQADIFCTVNTPPVAPVTLAVDGDNIPFGAPAPGAASGLFDFSLTGGVPPHDELDALSSCDPLVATSDFGLVTLFTLAPGSPTLGFLGLSSADVLMGGPLVGPPVPAVPAPALGLTPGDAINSLAFDSTTTLAFTLAPGSFSLGLVTPSCGIGPPLPIGPEDALLSPGAGFFCYAGDGFGGKLSTAAGLIPGDVQDAMDIRVDADADFVNDFCDNCVGTPNNDQVDSDADTAGDACDVCPGFSDFGPDADLDTIPDACDVCPGGDDTLDADSDSVPDGCDTCAGFDDADISNPCEKLFSVSKDDDLLRLINPTTGQTLGTPTTMTLSGETINGANGLAIHPTTGDLYVLLKLASSPTTRELAIVDAVTGTVTAVGDTGDRFAGLAFDTAGTLYGVTGDGASVPETGYTLSTVDGSATFLVTAGAGSDGEAIAFNPNDFLIYHASGLGTLNDAIGGAILETIDGLLTFTSVTLSGPNYSEIAALTWYQTGSVLLAANISAHLYSVTTTGTIASIGPMDHTSKGLAVAAFVCGNGTCESVAGEDDSNCAVDCGCAAGSPDSCGGSAPFGCFCDDVCFSFGDCCVDACSTCGDPTCPDFCGNLVTEAGNGEICDGDDDAACVLECQGDCTCPVCGDGDIEGSEECDDGNTADGDCCSSTCTFEAPGASCGDASDTVCANPDTCDGAGTCDSNDEAPGTACGDASDTDCTNPDTCDGSGACEINDEAPGTACGDGSDTECANPDTCDGAGTCDSNDEAPGTACGDSSDTECANPDTCDGAGTCDGNDEAPGTACGDSGDTVCTDPDTCDGAGGCEPNHEVDATPCDDTNVCTANDACLAGVCGGEMPTCLAAEKASFQVKDKDGEAKDQIKWKWQKGPELVQADLGNPDTTASYSLCIYDTTADIPSLAGTLTVPPSTTLWQSKDPKGWKYKDKAGSGDGVTGAAFKTGAAGKTKAQIKAKGSTVNWPVPISATEFFDQDTTVKVQLVNDETPTCFDSSFSLHKKNDGAQFKAKSP
jgi:hypothetical protein